MVIDIKKRLQDEITTLEYELKVELPKEILRAREHGDLRENAEYHAARNEQSFLEGRVQQLEQRIRTAVVIEAEAGGAISMPGAIIGPQAGA